MSNLSSQSEIPDVSFETLRAGDPAPSQCRDRSTPMWAKGLSLLFSLGGGVCVIAVAVFVVFFYDLVAISGQTILAPLLAAGAMVPILGILIFEVGHARALSGYRHIRTRHAVIGKALMGIMAGLVFGILHPLLALPFVIGAVLSWLLCALGARWMHQEPMWEFLPQEAAAFLSGKDARAVELANDARADSPLLDGCRRMVRFAALIGGFAMASWLAAVDIVNVSAIATIALISYWSVDAFACYFRQMSRADPELRDRAHHVTALPAPFGVSDTDADVGLIVSHLSVSTKDGIALLSDVSFRAEPGAVIGISGDSFSGKSLLAGAIQAPQDLTGLIVEGHVRLNGTSTWVRSSKDRPIASVLVPPDTLAVPGGGANNLACFSGAAHLDRAQRVLKTLVFTSDTVARITNSPDVRSLSRSECKALAFARAFALRPNLYLFDRPEDGASESLLAAFGERLKSESRMGNISLIITENRLILERCDHLLMMQNGRVIEFAPSTDIRARLSSGWSRFVTQRDLDNEEPLDAWLSSQFRRDGDEGNRRSVCMIANELLSVACQNPPDPDGPAELVSFEFKHFVGKCQLRLIDPRLTLSSGAMQKARVAADTSVEGERLSPLAKIMRDSLDVDAGDHEGNGCLQVSVKTYDPRLLETRKVSKDVKQQR